MSIISSIFLKSIQKIAKKPYFKPFSDFYVIILMFKRIRITIEISTAEVVITSFLLSAAVARSASEEMVFPMLLLKTFVNRKLFRKIF